ncbi:MAG: cyclase family protein [Crocinitomicaceae bacterium]|nr:cyclase family protein [Crocinitomicaceae bacterium]
MKLYVDKGLFIETNQPLDISIPITTEENSVRAWYCGPVKIEPVRMGDFIGDVNQGGSVNFKNIFLNPHGNGTHTECVGHISKEHFTINQCLKEFHFFSMVISVNPQKVKSELDEKTDLVITKDEIVHKLNTGFVKGKHRALIIRTLPNQSERTHKNYTETNPPYLSEEAIRHIVEAGIDHLIMDVPSVDREVDHGKLTAHHIFWNYPAKPQLHKTITELAFIDNTIADGEYFLNIQIASYESDASPSKLVLYKIQSE